MATGAAITRILNRGLFIARKNADKIELVGGSACVGAGTFLLIKDADKIAAAQDELITRINFIKESDADPDGWESKEDRSKYIKETIHVISVGYVKSCWKGVTLILIGEFLQYLSHATVNKRYQIANTALAGTTLAFNNYRKRVVEDQGAAKDQEYLTGDGTMVSVEQKSDGTVTTTEVPLHKLGDSKAYFPHSFFLGDTKGFYLTSGNNGNIERGIEDVKRGLHYANQKAQFKGYVFENEARERCNVVPTVAGQAAGMFYNEPDGSTNTLTLMSHGVEIGDPSLLDGKPEDILFEFTIKNTAKDGTISLRPLDDNILNRIDASDPRTNEPIYGWLKC